MSNTLYVIAVPIGNLKEITLLAKEKLEESSVIFCEDTRVTRKLLIGLEIGGKQKLISINQFNESEMCDEVVKHLENSTCSLVSDAGYPVISDPGFFLIKKLREKNIPIQVINGPCAFIHAIVGSGIDSRKLFFVNFLSKKELKRKSELKKLIDINKEATIIYYEPKNFFVYGLEILREIFGDIKVGVARELTKQNETFYFDTITNLLQTVNVKGEFVVIIPRNEEEIENLELDDLLKKIHLLITKKQLTLKDSIKVYKNKNHSSSFLYSEYIKKYKN